MIIIKGAFILSILRSSPAISGVDIIARREPPAAPTDHSKTRRFVEKDTAKWAPHVQSRSPAPQVFFSALATTRAAAGGFENQYRIEHDLNLELAKAAKEAGTKVYVLISAAGANKDSMFGYMKMKGEIEDDIKALGFEHTIIVQPGLITGRREESRPMEAVMRHLAGFAGMISSHYLKDTWAQDADVIAKASVSASLKTVNGEVSNKVWVLKAADIVRLGRTDWK